MTVEPGDRRARARRDRPHGRAGLASSRDTHGSFAGAPRSPGAACRERARGGRRDGRDRSACGSMSRCSASARSTSRRAPGRGHLGSPLLARRLGREHARVQLLLPPAGPHVHAVGLENWFALAIFVVVAVVVSELAARSRRRAREASLLAEIAGSLLEHGTVSGELERISAEAARALQVERARISARRGRPGGTSCRRRRRVGSIHLAGRGRAVPPRGGGCCRRWRRSSPSRSTASGSRRGARGRGAPARRRDQDRAPARGQPRSATPLMAISTSAGALARDDLCDRRRGSRGAARRRSSPRPTRLDRLVGNLLDLSRLQAGAASPSRSSWSVDDLVVERARRARRDGRPCRGLLPGRVAARARRRRPDPSGCS